MNSCPTCGTAMGKRRRCYVCDAPPWATGETRTCKVCGVPYYLERNQIADVARNTGTYCSRTCKGAYMKTQPRPWAKPEEKTRHSAGYVLVWAPEHPRANAGRVLEHILVAERELGRPLEPGEEVHHRDHVKTNNDPSNLVVLTASEHASLHAAESRVPVEMRFLPVTCQQCGKVFHVKPSKVNGSNLRNRAKFCSMECRRASWPEEMQAKKLTKQLQRRKDEMDAEIADLKKQIEIRERLAEYERRFGPLP